jgi:PAS domain S-box-containing protein
VSVRSLVDSSLFGTAESAIDFIGNVLESSTEYSIIATHLDGTIVLWNEGARRIYGYEAEEVVGQLKLTDLYAPDVRDSGEPESTLRAAVANGKWEGIVDRVRKSGERFKARVVLTLRRDATGEPNGFLVISKNISDELRLTEELRETQYYTRSLIESNIDALMTTDVLGVITDVNQQMETLTGYSREDLIGSPFKQYFTDPDRAEAGIKHVVQQGKITNYELTARHVDGRETVVSYNASTFRDAQGRVRGVFAAARDITEQKELEQQLRDSQSYTRSLIESNIDALMTTDPDGIITDVNAQMETLTGCSRTVLIGTPFKEYFTDPEVAEAGIRMVLREGKVSDYELVARHRTGRETFVSYNATTFYDRDGKLQGVLAAARDVTERTRFEQKLWQKTVELEQASLAKDIFLASMSHELRTPLNAIIGFTGTLLMKLPGPLNEEQEHQLRTVQSSGRHLLSIINDLLDLAKIESGKVELKLEQVDCRRVVDDVVQSLRPLAENKGLVLEAELPDGEVRANSDRRALGQILINLVNNAIKFTEAGKVRVSLVPARGGAPAQIRVSDTGPGIPEPDQERIFHAFERGAGAGVRGDEGTGLGLHISQKLADLLHARITVESLPGSGATFAVMLEG